MKFIVTRTSDFHGETAPCEGAYKERHDRWDVRTFKTFAEYDGKPFFSKPFTSEGVDHKETPEGIERRFPNGAESWFVDLDGLDGFVRFCMDHGGVIVERDDLHNTNFPVIEIYDTYRE